MIHNHGIMKQIIQAVHCKSQTSPLAVLSEKKKRQSFVKVNYSKVHGICVFKVRQYILSTILIYLNT